MAKSVNKVILLGYAGRDPEVRSLRSGTKVNLSLATNEPFRDRQGNLQERTEWHNLVGYQRIAEILRDYVRKGSQIFIEGKLHNRFWDDKETGQRRYWTEVVVLEVSLLSSAPDMERNHSRVHPSASHSPATPQYEEPEIAMDEIPF